ncbi:MAG: class I SAM-dependent methyltransferase [Flavobacteriaceae bacterium]
MNKAILNIQIQEFINDNLETDLVKLALKGSPFPAVTIQELITQIESKNKAKQKLPSWFNTENIYYPPKLNLEQTSSEITAQYKASLVSGKSLADITGGLGIDSYYFAKSFEKVYHFEIDKDLSEIASHNFSQLNSKVTCIAENGITSIDTMFFDIIYMDPSRRHDSKGKVFYLNDCEPNVVEQLDYLLKRCDLLLVKTSPMLDITEGLRELKHVFEVHIVAVKNEVKELLWLVKKGHTGDLILKTVNLKSNKIEFFEAPFPSSGTTVYSNPKKYIYEPNAAIMKSGLFFSLSNQYQVEKMAVNTHLFTSDEKIAFPGRGFDVLNSVPYSKAEIKKHFSGKRANITTRNFPETVAALKQRWKIKDGGDKYLFFTTNKDKKKVILECVKI